MAAREKGQQAGVRNSPGQHRASEGGRVQRGGEQRGMEAPALTASGTRLRENQMAAVGLVRPVVAARPLGQHRRQRGGGPDVGRMYKSINDFPIREGRGPPREQEPGQVHGAPLTRGAGEPTIALSYPFELPDPIFDAFTSPPRDFARRRTTEQRHTWISLN